MWRADMNDVFGIFAGIVLGLGFFALIAYLVYLFVYKRIQMNHEMRLEMIKQGLTPPTERESYGSLKAGIVSVAVGAGFLVGMLFQSSAENEPLGGEIVVALVPLFIGAGLVLFHLLYKKHARHESAGRYLPSSSVPEP
jgi:hypothetical protein